MALLSRFAPPVALMALIYFLSSRPHLNTGLGEPDLIGRKIVHMVEYGVLFLLWLRAFGWRTPVAAAAIVIAYAVTDEIHQASVPGRHGKPHDVLIDAVGVALAWVLLRAARSGRLGRLRPTASRAR